jgi:hypothetical protein
MFKFVAISLIALGLTACAGKEEEEVVAEEVPAVEAAPEAPAAADAAVPAEGINGTVTPPETTVAN